MGIPAARLRPDRSWLLSFIAELITGHLVLAELTTLMVETVAPQFTQSPWQRRPERGFQDNWSSFSKARLQPTPANALAAKGKLLKEHQLGMMID